MRPATRNPRLALGQPTVAARAKDGAPCVRGDAIVHACGASRFHCKSIFTGAENVPLDRDDDMRDARAGAIDVAAVTRHPHRGPPRLRCPLVQDGLVS
jgi:hypothetical protein